VIRIKKIKITSDHKISASYEKQVKNGTWDEYSFTCSDQARPEFYEAMGKLAPHVIEMCELPSDYLERIEVRSVSVSYGGENEVMGATITSQMQLEKSNCNLNLNTPYKASESYSDAPADEKQLLSEDCVNDLYKLYEECELYINGDRAQGSLFEVA
jgi:hypothetical protein